MAMPGKRKRSELKQLSAELAKRNRKGKSNTKPAAAAAARTSQSVPLPKVYLGRVVDKEDPYSRLSDDIIVCHILTRLSLREVVKTSVLSRRWRNLWTASIGSKLIFSYPDNHDFRLSCSELRPILARGISRILEVVKPTFDELTIRYNLNCPSIYEAVNRWVQIALTNKVTRLHLDFSSSSSKIIENKYAFPAIHSDSVKYPGIHNLRDVCLKDINVSGEVIEGMLSNCPSLERLVVWGSRFQQRIRVCTQSSKFKSLEFVNCWYERIEISSPNLTYLRHSCYDEFFLGFQLDYVPLLSELSIGSSYCKSFLRHGARDFINYIPQLKRLKLDVDDWSIGYTKDFLRGFPKLIKLEQLEVELGPSWGTTHLWLIMLLNAAPSLQKCSIKLNLDEVEIDLYPDEAECYENLLNNIRQVRHPSLKLIEMLNFSGSSSEMEFGKHLLSITPLLEQFILSLFDEGVEKNPLPRYDGLVPVEKYRRKAQRFDKWLPPTANLVIL